jgi:Tfp pilus assembly protein PilO
MSTLVFLLTLTLPLITIVVVFAMRYFAIMQQAKASLAQQGQYRRLAETAIAAQADSATALAAIQVAMTELRGRLAGIEKVLKDVE